jgi:uncharacterized membrane protein YciS (DUF1049 family)
LSQSIIAYNYIIISVDNDLGLLYPTLTATDLANGWAYAAAFPDEIEIAIRENDETDEILDTPENIN